MKKKTRAFVSKSDIFENLKNLNLKNGDSVFVHCSLSSFGFVCGGAQVIIEALIEVLGKDGTIIMPTQTWKNLDPSTGVHWEEPKEWWENIRKNWPAYDKNITPTNTMGAVAEMFRTWPGTLRSDHPARSFAAFGKHSEYLTKNHDLSIIFGQNSPLDKFYRLNGKILLLGVGYEKCTSLHLADELATYPSKHSVEESSAMFIDGKRKWVTYNTLFVDGDDFETIGKSFEEENSNVVLSSLGNGIIRLINQRELVDFAIEWIEKNRK